MEMSAGLEVLAQSDKCRDTGAQGRIPLPRDEQITWNEKSNAFPITGLGLQETAG